MVTIQMTLDEDLVSQVDQLVRELQTSRSAFTRDALRLAIKKFKIMRLEEQQRRGYQSYPVHEDEFKVAEDDNGWSDL